MQVTADDVRGRARAARASVGSTAPPRRGRGRRRHRHVCFDFKGGIGTASRVTPEGHTVGVLLMTNFGVRDRLRRGRCARRPAAPPPEPARPGPAARRLLHRRGGHRRAAVDGAACARLARRVGLGLARTGSIAHHGSGEIFLGFGDRPAGGPRRAARRPGPGLAAGRLDPLFAAVVDATEEAVLNSMLTAPTTTGRDGHTSPSLHSPEVLALLEVR